MEVRVFKFNVSNYATGGAFASRKEEADKAYDTCTPERISTVISAYLKGKKNATVQVTPVAVSGHNNGGGNTVELWYTITHD